MTVGEFESNSLSGDLSLIPKNYSLTTKKNVTFSKTRVIGTNKPTHMSFNTAYHMTEEKLLEEKEVIEAAKRDPKHFAPLYEKYYEQIFRYLHQRMNDLDDSAEVCSRVFMKAMTKIQKFEYRGVPFSAWLYRIAYNELNQFYRKSKKQKSVNMDQTQMEEVLADFAEGENESEKMSQKRKLLELLKTLDDSIVEMIEMRFFDQMSFREIGEVLEITENNAKVKFYRIMQRIKKSLK